VKFATNIMPACPTTPEIFTKSRIPWHFGGQLATLINSYTVHVILGAQK